MKITDIKTTTVTVPLEAPLRHSNGAHWGRFVRTVVEIKTDEGITGLGEMGGGGESAALAFQGLKTYLVGHDPFDLNRMRFAICNPTASLYNNRTQLHAALEFACLDIIGKKLGVPVYQLLGGRLRDEVGFASYLFYRYANPQSGKGEVRTIDQLVDHAKALKEEHGFTSHKLKAGVFNPDYELECYRALASAFPDDTLRYDPNAALSVEQALRFGQAIAGLRNDYFEDPTWGLAGMRRLREKLSTPLATNTIVIDFQQLATNVRDPAVDVILLDTTLGWNPGVYLSCAFRDTFDRDKQCIRPVIPDSTSHDVSSRGCFRPLLFTADAHSPTLSTTSSRAERCVTKWSHQGA
jgi:glucarate dehydratase